MKNNIVNNLKIIDIQKFAIYSVIISLAFGLIAGSLVHFSYLKVFLYSIVNLIRSFLDLAIHIGIFGVMSMGFILFTVLMYYTFFGEIDELKE